MKNPFLEQFRRQEKGGTTVEFVIWTPLVVAALMLAIDFSYVMTLNASMWNSARNTARAMAIHELRPDQAESFLEEAMFFRGRPYEIEIRTLPDRVQVAVRLDGEDAALTPFLANYFDGRLGARIVMFREPV